MPKYDPFLKKLRASDVDLYDKGKYANEAAINIAYPTGELGWFVFNYDTDTWWVWDGDSSAWVDTDTKGAVDSVNGDTGIVVLVTADIEESTNLYYTESRVSANLAVVANSAKFTNATHTGDVTGAGALTIVDKKVTLAKMNDMATASFIGRNTAGVGVPEVLSVSTVKSLLNFTAPALDNLASVAINESLVSDTYNTDSLGTSAIPWSDLYLGNEAVIDFSTAASTSDITITHSSGNLTFAGGDFVFSTSITTPIIKPSADSTSAIQITKADGTTPVITIDTTNGAVGIGRAAVSTRPLSVNESIYVTGGTYGTGFFEGSRLLFQSEIAITNTSTTSVSLSNVTDKGFTIIKGVNTLAHFNTTNFDFFRGVVLSLGTATAGTSPLKFTLPGAVLNTTAEAGALEVDSSGVPYITNAAVVRKKLGADAQAMYIEANIPNNNSELALHFELQIYSDATYDTSIETFNSSSSQTNIELFDGTDWVAMPAGGAVLAYYGNKIRFALQTAVAGTIYYTRIRTLYLDGTWKALSDWYAGTYPNFPLHIPDITPVAVAALTKSSNTDASAYHKHSSVEYDEGAESGAVSLDFSRGNYQTMATVSGTPITSITMSNSGKGDMLEIEVDNANATTVTPKATELIGAGETGKYIITLRNIGGVIMVDKTKMGIE